MNRDPRQRPERNEWHKRDRNLEDAAAVTRHTISRESPYSALSKIGRGRRSEFAHFDLFHSNRVVLVVRKPLAVKTWRAAKTMIEAIELSCVPHHLCRGAGDFNSRPEIVLHAMPLGMMDGFVREHKFKLGQSVSFASAPFGRAGTKGIYRVTQLLPPAGDDYQYRIKSANEPHERLVKESQLDHISLMD